MTPEPLYRKVMKGKTVRYEPVQPEPEDDTVTTVTFTDRECVTVGFTLGLVLLKLAKINLKPHQLIPRKIKAVEVAIADLVRDTGEPLKLDIAEGVMHCWDETMKRISVEGIDDSLIRRAA